MPYTEIRRVINPARLASYDRAAAENGRGNLEAIELYEWNAQLSAAFHVPLHLIEVAIRNAVDAAVGDVYNPRWPWDQAFILSLSDPSRGISARRELRNHAASQHTTGKVIAELKFVFWEQMFTTSHLHAIWDSQFRNVFPHADPASSVRQEVIRLRSEIEALRLLRNRIAHYEPIFGRPLAERIDQIERMAGMISPEFREWLVCTHSVRSVLRQRPEWWAWHAS